MKTLLSTVLLASICLLANLRADLTIVQKVDGLGQDMQSTTKIKGAKTRIDASPETSIIMDMKTGDMVSVMHAQKKYLRVPSQMAQAAMESMKKMQGDQPNAAPALTATGKKDTIAGYPAEEYTYTFAGRKMSLWLTKAMPDYQEALKEMGAAFNNGPMASMMKSMGVDFATLAGFPVRTVSEMQPGQTVTSTVVSVSTKPVPDTDFDIPPDYQEMKMPTLTPPASQGAPAVSK